MDRPLTSVRRPERSRRHVESRWRDRLCARQVLPRSRKCPRRAACPPPRQCSAKVRRSHPALLSARWPTLSLSARSRPGAARADLPGIARFARTDVVADRRFNATSVYSQGHLLLLRERTLMAQPFDAQTSRADRRDVSDCRTGSDSRHCLPVRRFLRSENGVLAYQTGTGAVGSQLAWFDRKRQADRRRCEIRRCTATWSFLQTGNRLALAYPDSQGGRDIWVYDVARGLTYSFYVRPSRRTRLDLVTRRQPHLFSTRNRKGHLRPLSEGFQRSRHEEVLLEDDLDKIPLELVSGRSSSFST